MARMQRVREAVFDDDDLSGVAAPGTTATTTTSNPLEAWMKSMPTWFVPAAIGFVAGWLLMSKRGD